MYNTETKQLLSKWSGWDSPREATKGNVCLSRKEIHTKIDCVIDPINTNGFFFHRLVKLPQTSQFASKYGHQI